MNQNIKEKDIRDFEKYAKKLSEVVERIREYNPNASGFMECDCLCLMSDEWRGRDCYPNDICATAINMPHFDGGAW